MQPDKNTNNSKVMSVVVFLVLFSAIPYAIGWLTYHYSGSPVAAIACVVGFYTTVIGGQMCKQSFQD